MAVKNESNNPAGGGDIVLTNITRIFDAPQELVFKAWTDPEHLARWYAPQGCTIHFAKMDLRVGGTFHSCIKVPAYGDCWCIGTYLEVVEPERLVHTMVVADENGRAISAVEAGMDPDWPQETVLTVTFTAMGNKTKVTLHQTVSEALAKRTGAYPSWLQMLDRLADLLAAG